MAITSFRAVFFPSLEGFNHKTKMNDQFQTKEQSKSVESTKALQAGSAVELKLIDGAGNPYTIDELKALTDDQIKDARVGIYQNGEYNSQ